MSAGAEVGRGTAPSGQLSTTYLRRAQRYAILGTVTEKEIRALLSSLQPSPFIDRTPGTVAVMRSKVEEAGADPDAVAQWVEAKGGRVDRTQSYFVAGHGPRCGHKVSHAKEFYVVPVDALAK